MDKRQDFCQGLYKWPKEDWSVRLIPILTSKAQSLFVAMSPSSTKDYDILKEVVLKKYDINAETYHQQFRARETPVEESP